MNNQDLILEELENVREEDRIAFLNGALWGMNLASKIAKEELNK